MRLERDHPGGRSPGRDIPRRGFLPLLLAALGAEVAAASGPSRVRGKLSRNSAGRPVLADAAGNLTLMLGDEPTVRVLLDPRLAGSELEAAGEFRQPGAFRVDPIHTQAMYIHKDGKKLFITYWCDVCAIRTYTPGTCWCCQEETALDLREKLD